MYNGTLIIGSNGFKVNLPSANLPLQWNVSVSGLLTNSADVFVGQYRLSSGRTVTIPTVDPTSLWLSGASGDGVSYQGS